MGENAALAEITNKAKVLRSKLAEEMKQELRKWSKELLTNVGRAMKEVFEGVLGHDAFPESNEKLYSQIDESLGLSTKGVETKLLQKLDETMGIWVTSAKKEM